MALIIAECEARNGNISEAQKYVGYTAKRDSQYAAEDGSCDLSKLPRTRMLSSSLSGRENTREFLGEGHFYSEARRLDKTVTVMAGTCTTLPSRQLRVPDSCSRD